MREKKNVKLMAIIAGILFPFFLLLKLFTGKKSEEEVSNDI